MGLHFVTLGVIIVFLFLMGMLLGSFNKAKIIERCFSNDKEITAKQAERTLQDIKFECGLSRDNKGIIGFIVWGLFCVGLCFADSYEEMREHFINQYREDVVVERVEYTYKIVNGEKVAIDSTFTYIKNK